MTAVRRYGLAVIASLTAILTFPVFAAAASFPAPPGPASSGVAGSYGGVWVSGTTTGSSWLSGVSCTAAFTCTAVGGAVPYPGGANRSAAPVVAYFDGSSWIIEPTDTTDSGSVLTAVACTPTLSRLCLALGSDGAFSYALIEGADGTWTQTAPMIRVAQNIGFDGAACPSRTRCIAAGDSYNSVSTPAPLVESWNGKSWHVAKLAAVGRGGGLSSVSCATDRLCVAVGSTPGPSGTYRPLAFEWTGGPAWQRASLEDPSKFTAGFSGVSCVKSSCTAVGSAGAAVFTETWHDGSWSNPFLYSVPRTTLDPMAISCVSGGACVVVGNTVVAVGPATFGAVEKDGRWSSFSTSRFPPGIQALTCSQVAGACVIVGGGSPYANTTGVEPAQAGVFSY